MPTSTAAACVNSPLTLAIRAAADQGRPRLAIALYVSSLRSDAHRPCPFALAAVLKSVSRLPVHALAAAAAASFHAHLLRLGLLAHPYPHAALAHLYSRDHPDAARSLLDETPPAGARSAHSLLVSRNSLLSSILRSGDLPAARALFDQMPVRDVVSWNSMVAGLAKAGRLDSAIELFHQMPERNAASWNAVMCGLIAHGQLARAREWFEEMPVRSNVSWIMMISGYAKAGDVQAAASFFERMENKNDLYAWNAMIACYAQNGCAREAISVFNRMLKPHVCVLPNEKTFSSVISACSQLGDLRFGLWVESFMCSLGIELDDHLRTALMDLYTKSGRIDSAFKLFRGLRTRDVVSYSAMIVGCGMNGKLSEAIGLFKEMSDAKIVPNAVTFVGLLSAYNHAGLMEEAQACFAFMSSKYNIRPSMEHYTIMVDLLGRNGKLDEAFQLITKMPMQPHASVWGALLLACRLHNNVELGEVVASKCSELAPLESGYYVLLGNIYAQANKWDKVKRLRKKMMEIGLSIMSGEDIHCYSIILQQGHRPLLLLPNEVLHSQYQQLHLFDQMLCFSSAASPSPPKMRAQARWIMMRVLFGPAMCQPNSRFSDGSSTKIDWNARSNLFCKNIVQDDACPRCFVNVESCHHLFFGCTPSVYVRTAIGATFVVFRQVGL